MATGSDLAARAHDIRRLVLDVDGVLTDGTLLYGPDGEALKAFSVRDGLAIVLARRVGIETTLLTARRSPMLSARAADLGIADVHQGVRDKAAGLAAVLERHALEAGQIAAIGDDLPDLPVLAAAGISYAPADAAPETRAAATITLEAPGGRGAVREMVEHLLRLRRQWETVVADFAAPS